MRGILSFSAATLFAASASAQLVTGSITDGNVTYAHNSFPTTTTSAAGLGNFLTAGQDNLYQATWYYRIAGDSQEFAFNSGAAQGWTRSTYLGNRVLHFWADVDNRGIAALRDIRVYSTGATAGVCLEKLTVTNNTGAAIQLNLFAYADFDQCASAGGDGAVANPTPDRVRVTDTACTAVTGIFAPGADNHEVTPFPVVRGKLLDLTVDDLNNTGLPFGPGDFTGAWQWQNRTVSDGGSFTAYFIMSVDAAHSGCVTPAGLQTYGAGKAGTNGVPNFDWSVLPLLGAVTNLTIYSGVAGSTPYMILGGAATNIPFPPFGTILVDLTGAAMFFGAPFDGTNRSVTPIPIPNRLILCNANLFVQAFIVDAGAPGFVSHTGGMIWTLGGVH